MTMYVIKLEKGTRVMYAASDDRVTPDIKLAKVYYTVPRTDHADYIRRYFLWRVTVEPYNQMVSKIDELCAL